MLYNFILYSIISTEKRKKNALKKKDRLDDKVVLKFRIICLKSLVSLFYYRYIIVYKLLPKIIQFLPGYNNAVSNVS